jgi:thiol-disulfide isomerase/thioredoxin
MAALAFALSSIHGQTRTSGFDVADTGDQRATRLARAAHAEAAGIDQLPRFDYQIRCRRGVIDAMRAVDRVTIEGLRAGLTAPVLGKDWLGGGGFHEIGLSWDEKWLLFESRPGNANMGYSCRFGTATQGWDRMVNRDMQTVSGFTRRASVSDYWSDPDGRSSMHLFDLSYFRVTPHQFWWGRTVTKSNGHQMDRVPLDEVTWKNLGAENLGGEECEVVESKWTKTEEPRQRLWIGKASGRLRGVLQYFASAQANELALFEDYRQVAPGVWLPFRETRTHSWVSEKRGKHSIVRSELAVMEARTGVDLNDRCTRLLPKEGEQVQDQRFGGAVDYAYSTVRKDDEIRAIAAAKNKKNLEEQEEARKMIAPYDALVGKPAPALPADGWVGGPRPDLKGKPYLIHFWATWCGPCKGDFRWLKTFTENGFTVVGLHPAGTPAAEVEKVIREQKLGYSTFLAPGDAKKPAIGGYPAAVFPYSIMVDAQGFVVKHGPRHEMHELVDNATRLQALGGKPAPALDAKQWLNIDKGLTLAQAKGKVVLLDFWGKWCGPCVANLPKVEELHARFKDRGLVVVGVHTPDRSDKLEEFLKERKVSIPVMIDGGQTATRYDVGAWPTYFLIDRSGQVAWGFSHEPPTASRIDELLGK